MKDNKPFTTEGKKSREEFSRQIVWFYLNQSLRLAQEREGYKNPLLLIDMS